MDENHQDKTESKLVTTEDVRWGVNRKSKLWVPKHKKRTGFEGKTLWDCLDLIAKLAIPIVVLGTTIGFGWWQAHLADLQHQSDQQRALDQQQATILQTYIDNIQDLLLNHNLLKSSDSEATNPYYEVAIIARARTLTALQGLDPNRKDLLVQFLYGALLIGVGIRPANIDLFGANLSGAHLNDAFLLGANLSAADLTGADLSAAQLNDADLYHARLDFARNLTQQQLDTVSSCKGAILPEGLTCHHNQSPP